ncbi:MAG: DUF1956 domain-containing protein [Verrucomicrobia bacterium]|nr:DUF1956 domain-containing protein [Verrucomicrobiota bacterium]
MIAERIQPMADQLRTIVRAIVGPDCPEESLRLCGFSIVSQCLFYNHCRSVVTRLFPDQPPCPAALDRLADHITQFSLAALQHFPRPRPLPGRRRHSPKPSVRTQTQAALPPAAHETARPLLQPRPEPSTKSGGEPPHSIRCAIRGARASWRDSSRLCPRASWNFP